MTDLGLVMNRSLSSSSSSSHHNSRTRPLCLACRHPHFPDEKCPICGHFGKAKAYKRYAVRDSRGGLSSVYHVLGCFIASVGSTYDVWVIVRGVVKERESDCVRTDLIDVRVPYARTCRRFADRQVRRRRRFTINCLIETIQAQRNARNTGAL